MFCASAFSAGERAAAFSCSTLKACHRARNVAISEERFILRAAVFLLGFSRVTNAFIVTFQIKAMTNTACSRRRWCAIIDGLPKLTPLRLLTNGAQ